MVLDVEIFCFSSSDIILLKIKTHLFFSVKEYSQRVCLKQAEEPNPDFGRKKKESFWYNLVFPLLDPGYLKRWTDKCKHFLHFCLFLLFGFIGKILASHMTRLLVFLRLCFGQFMMNLAAVYQEYDGEICWYKPLLKTKANLLSKPKPKHHVSKAKSQKSSRVIKVNFNKSKKKK